MRAPGPMMAGCSMVQGVLLLRAEARARTASSLMRARRGVSSVVVRAS